MLCELARAGVHAEREPIRRGRRPTPVTMPRLALASLTGLAALVLGACAQEVDDPVGDTTPTTATTSSGPGGSAAPGGSGDAITHPTAPEQAIVRVSSGGGFVPRGYDFITPPELVIEGDGTVFQPGAQIEIYPAPLLPAITAAPLDEEGIQVVLAAAEDAGLLAPPPSYEPDPQYQVADAPTTVVEIHANGQTYRHEAYALGFDAAQDESTPARKAMVDFLNQVRDLPTLVGDHLGEAQPYTPERFGVFAEPAAPEELQAGDDGIAPTVVAWPDAAGSLAAMQACTEVPAASVGDAFQGANQLTRFSQAGVTYTVFVRVLLPDEDCATVTGS
jgi:hypothetical protein